MAKLPSIMDMGSSGFQSGRGVGRNIVSYQPISGKETLPGEAAAKFGAALQDVGDMINKQKLADDKLRAEDGYNQLLAKKADLTSGDDGFMNKRSGDAVNQPIVKDYGERFDQSSKDIESSLADDQQKELFRRRSDVAKIKFNSDLANHLMTERKVYQNEVFKGTLDSETQDAASHWQDPNSIASNLVRINDSVSTMAEQNGWPQELKQANLTRAQSGVHNAVVMQALAADDLPYAKKWYDDHKDVMDPQVSMHIQNAIDRKEAKYERAVGKQIDGLNSVILAGFEPSREQMLATVQAAKGTSLEGEAAQMVATAGATSQFRRMTPNQQAVQLTRLESDIRKDPSKFDVNLLNHFRTIHEKQDQALKESPVTFAVKQGFLNQDDPAAQPLDLSKPENLGPQLSARFDLSRNMQNVYGSENKPLTPEEAGTLADALKRGTVQDKRAYLGKLYNASGGNSQGYNAMMAQIAPDDPVTAVAGVYAGRGMKSDNGRVVADYILQGQSILHPDKKSDGSPAGGKLLPMPKEKDMLDRFTNYEGDAFAGKDEARNAFYQSAKAIYAARSVEDGDYSGELNKSRWDSAIALSTGGIERHKGKSIVMPYGVDYSAFKNGLSSRVDALAETGRLDMSASRLKDVPLENVGDGRYVFRSGDGIIVGKDKQPIVIDFNKPIGPASSKVDIRELLRERQELQGRLDVAEKTNPSAISIPPIRRRLLEIDAQLPGGAIGSP